MNIEEPFCGNVHKLILTFIIVMIIIAKNTPTKQESVFH